MLSLKCLPGDTVFIRGTVVEAASDAFQVLIDDGCYLSLTAWVPAAECARVEDAHLLKPIRRLGRYLDR